MIQIQIPDKAKYIIETIQAAGFEAYVVGGCVRDSILGRTPEDWDITTSARPEQVKQLFRRTIDTGIQHGTVTVMLDKEGFEVTTYRVDGKYEDSRHPKEVTFTPNLEEDLKRRDFTINAMAYNETEGLIDIFGGLKDIEAKLIRMRRQPGGTIRRRCPAHHAGDPIFRTAGLRDPRRHRGGNPEVGTDFAEDQCGADSGGTD